MDCMIIWYLRAINSDTSHKSANGFGILPRTTGNTNKPMGTDKLTKGSDSPDVRNLPRKTSMISQQGASSCGVPPRELPGLANLWKERI
jgi:hypothetical protein